MKTYTNGIINLPAVGENTKWGVVETLKPEHYNNEIDIQFYFDIDTSKQTELETRVNNGEIISFNEMRSKYSPDQTQVNELIKWLNNNGFLLNN